MAGLGPGPPPSADPPQRSTLVHRHAGVIGETPRQQGDAGGITEREAMAGVRQWQDVVEEPQANLDHLGVAGPLRR